MPVGDNKSYFSIEGIQQVLLATTLELCRKLKLEVAEAQKLVETVRHLWQSYLQARLVAFGKNALPLNNLHRDKLMLRAIKNDGFTGIPGTSYDPAKYQKEEKHLNQGFGSPN